MPQIELLDVAGLVPGAHEGKGLGNKFLDDLRHADALIHVVDVSGTTDAEGKNTRGYDPSVDIEWLRGEIVRWIQGNLMEKWGSIRRRHVAIKGNAVDTLQLQFSGYGSNSQIVARVLDKMQLKEPLEAWSDETISKVVNVFTDEKFPTVSSASCTSYSLSSTSQPCLRYLRRLRHELGGGAACWSIDGSRASSVLPLLFTSSVKLGYVLQGSSTRRNTD